VSRQLSQTIREHHFKGQGSFKVKGSLQINESQGSFKVKESLHINEGHLKVKGHFGGHFKGQ
jgi:hypothetical protein